LLDFDPNSIKFKVKFGNSAKNNARGAKTINRLATIER